MHFHQKQEYDAIVVGSGMAGGWAMKELCENGLKTLVLERGRHVEHGLCQVLRVGRATDLVVQQAEVIGIVPAARDDGVVVEVRATGIWCTLPSAWISDPSAPRVMIRAFTRSAPVGVILVITIGSSGWRSNSSLTSGAIARVSPTDTA